MVVFAKIMKGESRDKRKTKFFSLTMPSHILSYPKIIKERNNATRLWTLFVGRRPMAAFFLRRFVRIERINPYFCRQKPRPMNERGASLL
jgi:hypothetical protein